MKPYLIVSEIGIEHINYEDGMRKSLNMSIHLYLKGVCFVEKYKNRDGTINEQKLAMDIINGNIEIKAH